MVSAAARTTVAKLPQSPRDRRQTAQPAAGRARPCRSFRLPYLLDARAGRMGAARYDVPVPISRFYGDRGVFDAMGRQLLPEAAVAAAARDDNTVRCWSAGCASDEEPYTLVIVWRLAVAQDWPRLGLIVLATDADEIMSKGPRSPATAEALSRICRRSGSNRPSPTAAHCFALGRNFANVSISSCRISGERCPTGSTNPVSQPRLHLFR
jgi:hypothetical protein